MDLESRLDNRSVTSMSGASKLCWRTAMPNFLPPARDAVRSRLWPLPVAAVALAVAAGFLIPQFDAHVDAAVPSWLTGVLFGGDANAGRTVLDAVSSSLITVTSLTFSLTVVTLQLASSQFSPRLLRTFTSDVFVQATLGLFLATFTFSLTVLRSVRSGGDSASPFVPRISITLSFALAVASVIGLVLFLAHLARQIRVETMLRDVHQNAADTIRTELGNRDGTQSAPEPEIPDRADLLMAGSSGFLVRVDRGDLLTAAKEADAVVVITAHPGSSVIKGTPIGRAWCPTGDLSCDTLTGLSWKVEAAVTVGYERTAVQDIGYGLRQLTDVANKALSPGINDPTTAIYALGHISALLGELAGRDLGPTVITDEQGRPRVVLHGPDLAQLVEDAISQPRRYGASDPAVMARLFALLAELAWRIDPGHHHVVLGQLTRLQDTVQAQDFDGVEREQLRIAGDRVAAVLHRPVIGGGNR